VGSPELLPDGFAGPAELIQLDSFKPLQLGHPAGSPYTRLHKDGSHSLPVDAIGRRQFNSSFTCLVALEQAVALGSGQPSLGGIGNTNRFVGVLARWLSWSVAPSPEGFGRIRKDEQ
jgi:hypothetical protein